MDSINKTDIREIQTALTSIQVTMASNTRDLAEHMRRTELLEGHVETLNRELIKLKTFFMLLGWGFGALATAITVATQVWKVFH